MPIDVAVRRSTKALFVAAEAHASRTLQRKIKKRSFIGAASGHGRSPSLAVFEAAAFTGKPTSA